MVHAKRVLLLVLLMLCFTSPLFYAPNDAMRQLLIEAGAK